MALYHSPLGLYEFQGELAAYCIARPRNLCVVDTGLGKTHVSLAAACIMFEDDMIDRLLIVAEGNKIREWKADVAAFTDLSAVLYRGDPAHRRRIRAKNTPVLIMTYETARNDLVVRTKRGRGEQLTNGPLMESFTGERLLVVYDEMPALGGRHSLLHRSQQMLINHVNPRIIGLTATPVTSGMESFYNLGRLLCPDLVGSETDFDRDHVVVRNQHRQAIRFKDAEGLAAKMAPVMLRKRKTDPDVIDQFPHLVEDFVSIELSDDHMAAYEDLTQLIDESGAEYGFNMLTAFANHPRSILHSEAKVLEPFLEIHPVAEIEALTCSKSEAVIRKIKAISKQGDQVIVFCRHVAVLRELAEDLKTAKVTVASYHGDFSQNERESEKARFKDGSATVLLMSKAGEKGINLPEAGYIINYDVPLLHSQYIQRSNRGSRIGSNVDGILVVVTYIASETAEEGAVALWNRRNDQSDSLQDYDVDPIEDEAFVSAQARLALIRQANKETNSEEPV